MQTIFEWDIWFFVSIGRDNWCVVEISNGFFQRGIIMDAKLIVSRPHRANSTQKC